MGRGLTVLGDGSENENRYHHCEFHIAELYPAGSYPQRSNV
jgi:hypothetical protein